MWEKLIVDISNNFKLMLDFLFKVTIIIMGIVYLIFYYNQTLNGRYVIVDKNSFPPTIIDTRSGIYYYSDTQKDIRAAIDQVNGTIFGKKIKMDVEGNVEVKNILRPK